MVFEGALRLLNHVLAGESWARDRLLPFAGQTARLECGRLAWVVKITEAGQFATDDTGLPPAVSIRLPNDALLRAALDRGALFSSATIAGSVDLAETLGFVFRNIAWDVEHDLSQLCGDVLARRALRVARSVGDWPRQGLRSVAQAAAEYFSEEDAAIAHRRDVERFCAEVDALRDDFARFEKRLARFELA